VATDELMLSKGALLGRQRKGSRVYEFNFSSLAGDLTLHDAISPLPLFAGGPSLRVQ